MPTIRDVILEVDPGSLQALQGRVQALANSSGAASFAQLQTIPHLHFMSMQIFQDRHFDPLLVFENNFDGTPDDYWPGVLSQLSGELRGIFACTKHAKLKQWSNLFAPGSTQPLTDFIVAHSCGPSAQHFGAVAYSVDRIRRDSHFFDDLQSHLGVAPLANPKPSAAQVQQDLRQWAIKRYDWMSEPESPTTAQALDAYKLTGWAPILATGLALLIPVVLLLWLCFSNYLPDHCYSSARHGLRVLVAVAVVLFFVLLFVLAALLLKKIRHLETTDFTEDDPELSPEELRLFAAAEDQIVQNHLASMVLVKPGATRAILIRASLGALKLLVPIKYWDGYLGTMRTIHFAHWTLVGNSGRLLFLSNFDGSWQSYLDDFVDKASRGLTLAWGNCIGFPRTKYLIREGAAHGTQFKAWARQSQTQNILWYSAYPELTVNQIIRNANIVDGLRKGSMREKEAEEWAQLL